MKTRRLKGIGKITSYGSCIQGCCAWETPYIDIQFFKDNEEDENALPEEINFRWQSDVAASFFGLYFVEFDALVRTENNRVFRMKEIKNHKI